MTERPPADRGLEVESEQGDDFRREPGMLDQFLIRGISQRPQTEKATVITQIRGNASFPNHLIGCADEPGDFDHLPPGSINLLSR